MASYSLGFFFGPGLPRGLGKVSIITPVLFLDPDAGFLRFFELSVGLVPSCTGAGVELDSETLSVDSVILRVGSSLAAGAGDDTLDDVDFGSSFSTGGAKRFSRVDDKRSTTMFCFLPRPFVTAGDDMAVFVVDISFKVW